MGTLGAKALLISKSPWLAAGWAGIEESRGRGALATSSLSKQLKLLSWSGGAMGFKWRGY